MSLEQQQCHLAWLESRPYMRSLTMFQTWGAAKTWPWRWSATAHYLEIDRRQNITAHAETLDHAIAHLVFLVAQENGDNAEVECPHCGRPMIEFHRWERAWFDAAPRMQPWNKDVTR